MLNSIDGVVTNFALSSLVVLVGLRRFGAVLVGAGLHRVADFARQRRELSLERHALGLSLRDANLSTVEVVDELLAGSLNTVTGRSGPAKGRADRRRGD